MAPKPKASDAKKRHARRRRLAQSMEEGNYDFGQESDAVQMEEFIAKARKRSSAASAAIVREQAYYMQ